ncbi:FHA domain-containing protein, partial [Mycolicibacterium llatzerense]|uniref:FHA domain-containing protein n=1 Tax=Mycolicibacterium llatzerense TaxID=280871 RepID=UPI00361ABB68
MGSGMVAPPLVVRLGDAMFTFPPGKEVIVGRGEGADVRIDVDAKQAISRTHMVLRVENGQWMAIDKSRNGIYADGIRVQTIPVDDNIPIALGAATGPKLIFKTATQAVPAARLATATSPAAPPGRPAPPPAREPQPPMASPPPGRPTGPVAPPRPTGAQRQPAPPAPQQFSPPQRGQQPPAPRTPQGPPSPPPGPPSGTIPRPAPAGPLTGSAPRLAGQPPAAGARPAPLRQTHTAFPPASPAPRPPQPSPADEADALAKMTGMVKRVLPQRGTPSLPPGAITIGRHSTSAIRIDDTLASRTHAYLLPAPTGMQIHDNNSNNGIFVNGVKVPAATLQAGDVVTIDDD